MKSSLSDRIRQGILFLDGAMGTQLMLAGCDTSGCNDYLNISHRETVEAVHSAYFGAGVHAVITNTFGASAIPLKRHGHGDKVLPINLAAARIARDAAGSDRYVLGDIGPCGDFIEPLGTIKPDDLEAAFAEQTQALVEGGVDGFVIETMTALDETVIAVQAVRGVSELPVFVCMSFDAAKDSFRTMMGISPRQMVDAVGPLGVSVIGFNCGTLDMTQYLRLTETFAAALDKADVPLIVQPNAGRPELIDGRARYSIAPDEFAESVLRIRNAGASIIGGCCGTTPDHIRAVVQRLS
jgi:5-methyltetrahydrofolate--homocysteine methyltransferase